MARTKSRRSRKKQTAKKRPARKFTRKKLARKRPAKKKPAKRRLARRKPRPTRATGGEWAVPRKFADTDHQIETLRHHVSAQCVSIASSIDTIPPEMIPVEMRDRWLRELRQAAVALVPVIERLATRQKTEA
jgi:hypothetical protein